MNTDSTNDRDGRRSTAARPSIVDTRPARTALFARWSPTLLAAALTVSTLAGAGQRASADAVPAARPGCSVPDRAAAVREAAIPDRPDIAVIEHATGDVALAVTLDAAGNATSVAVAHSSGNPWLDRAAVRSAERSRFSPEIAGCAAHGGTYRYDVHFNG